MRATWKEARGTNGGLWSVTPIGTARGGRPRWVFDWLDWHSGYPGGIYATPFKDMQAKHPGRALEKAVKGMLPKGPLGYAMVKKLKVYAGGTHPHAAQQPKPLEI